MNERDAEAFSRSLKEAFPALRFIPHAYWDIPTGKYSTRRRRAHEVNLIHYCHLGVPEQRRFTGWIEPEGWHPNWSGPNEFRAYIIANAPRFRFGFDRSFIPEVRPSYCSIGSIFASYPKGDKANLAFLNKVIRLSAKFTTNIVNLIDPQTRQVTYRNQRTTIWVGHDLLRWLSEDPARTLSENIRPADDWVMPDIPYYD